MVIALRFCNAKKSCDMKFSNFSGINSKLCHFIVDNRSHFISLQFLPAPTIGYDVYVMYYWVLSNSTGAVDCTGGGQTAGICNCTV